MKKGGGKRKGSEFERQVCKTLSLWVTDNERDDIFWRSAMSGGRATVKFKKGQNNTTQIGDISAIDPIGNFLLQKYVVECKSYKNLHFGSLLYGTPKDNSILGFWEKLNQICVANNKQPMLICKENGKPALVLLRETNLFDHIPLLISTANQVKVYSYDKMFQTNYKKFILL